MLIDPWLYHVLMVLAGVAIGSLVFQVANLYFLKRRLKGHPDE
jgi:hypothetical protein